MAKSQEKRPKNATILISLATIISTLVGKKKKQSLNVSNLTSFLGMNADILETSPLIQYFLLIQSQRPT